MHCRCIIIQISCKIEHHSRFMINIKSSKLPDPYLNLSTFHCQVHMTQPPSHAQVQVKKKKKQKPTGNGRHTLCTSIFGEWKSHADQAG